MGNLRIRMQPRLKAAGIALHRETQPLGDTQPLRPQDQLPVLRIIQESQTSQTDTELDIRIEDDGHGFDVEAARAQATGKGLNSLGRRACVLGAQLRISSSERGSVIWLRVPLEADRAS